MTRAGYVATSMAGLMAFAISAMVGVLLFNHGQQASAERQRLERLQGREWCLGLAQLTRPVDCQLGPWHLQRTREGVLSASGPAGTYRIDQDRHEHWVQAGTSTP